MGPWFPQLKKQGGVAPLPNKNRRNTRILRSHQTHVAKESTIIPQPQLPVLVTESTLQHARKNHQ